MWPWGDGKGGTQDCFSYSVSFSALTSLLDWDIHLYRLTHHLSKPFVLIFKSSSEAKLLENWNQVAPVLYVGGPQ